MDLKELLGEAYKDGMSFDEINTALSNKKLADLSTGKYVNKDAADAEKTRLENEKKDLENQLNAKLTDDEKTAKIAAEKDKQIEKLMQQLKENTISGNKGKIMGSTTEMRSKIGIEDTDEDFTKFVGLITNEDVSNNDYVASYLSKLIKSAYEKGEADAKKTQVAGNGNYKSGGDGKATDNKNENDIGKRLAQKIKDSNKNSFDYFERK
jgi:hypothetical protein